MKTTILKLRRILRTVISEAQGDGLSDPEVAAAYEELADLGFPDNVNRSDFAVDTDMSWLEDWPYSEALDIMHDQEGSYDDFEYEDTDEERYAEMETSMRARQNRGMYEGTRRTLKEHNILEEQASLSRLFPVGRMASALNNELARLMAEETGEDEWYKDPELMQVAQEILDQVKKVQQ